MGPTPATRATAYQALFTEVLDSAWIDSLRACTNGGFVLGSDRFQRQVAAMVWTPHLERLAGPAGKTGCRSRTASAAALVRRPGKSVSVARQFLSASAEN